MKVQVHYYIRRQDNHHHIRIFRYVDGASPRRVDNTTQARKLLKLHELSGKFLYGEILVSNQPTGDCFGDPTAKQEWLEYEATLGRSEFPGDPGSWLTGAERFEKKLGLKKRETATESLPPSEVPAPLPMSDEQKVFEANLVRAATISEMVALISPANRPTPAYPTADEIAEQKRLRRRRGQDYYLEPGEELPF